MPALPPQASSNSGKRTPIGIGFSRNSRHLISAAPLQSENSGQRSHCPSFANSPDLVRSTQAPFARLSVASIDRPLRLPASAQYRPARSLSSRMLPLYPVVLLFRCNSPQGARASPDYSDLSQSNRLQLPASSEHFVPADTKQPQRPALDS